MVPPLLQVDGGDRESRQLTWEGQVSRGRGMKKPILPDEDRAEEAELGQHFPCNCIPSVPNTGWRVG